MYVVFDNRACYPITEQPWKHYEVIIIQQQVSTHGDDYSIAACNDKHQIDDDERD